MTGADWESLRKLRLRFLDRNTHTDYWTPEILHLYDQSFGARIGWKWKNVLGTLSDTLIPEECRLLDWGAGTGVAGRAFFERFPRKIIYQAYDRSSEAMNYAHRQMGTYSAVTVNNGPIDFKDAIVLVSHVISELSDLEFRTLLDRLREAKMVIWVEPGNRDSAQKLSHVRDVSNLGVVAPCTHLEKCPLKCGEGWCHFFGRVPSEVFQSAFWSQFSRELGIDLRALPISFLVLGRVALVDSRLRIIGRPRRLSRRYEIETCSARGLERKVVPKSAKLFETLKKEAFAPEIHQDDLTR